MFDEKNASEMKYFHRALRKEELGEGNRRIAAVKRKKKKKIEGPENPLARI